MTALDLHNTLPADVDDAETDLSPEEQRRTNDLRAHRAMGLLMQLIPDDMTFTGWTITGSSSVDAMLDVTATGVSDDQARGRMRWLGRLLDGFEFTERPHNATRNRVALKGIVGGVDAELWVLLAPCHCRCHGASDGAR